jgi:lysophospholipase L1-like esterase
MFFRVALVIGVFVSMALSAKGKDVYLAVGDSIAFGYSPVILNPFPPSNFKGYPEFIATSPGFAFVQELNIACPGETSGSFLNATAPDNHCRDYKGSGGGVLLHVPYVGTQLSKMVQLLQTEKDISLVTINIGGNDLLLLQNACLANPVPSFEACVTTKLPTVLAVYAQNLSAILGAIRGQNSGKYKGKIALLTQYSTDYRPQDYIQQIAVSAFNSVARLASLTYNVKIADGYGAFAAASAHNGKDPCASGLLIPLSATTCDVHPSAAGQKLLADTVLAVINRN